VSLLILPYPSSGQTNSQLPSQPEKRIALVIGNGNYIGSTLANPENDARSIAEVLEELGFMVFKYENLNQSQMKRAIDDFGMKVESTPKSRFGQFYKISCY